MAIAETTVIALELIGNDWYARVHDRGAIVSFISEDKAACEDWLLWTMAYGVTVPGGLPKAGTFKLYATTDYRRKPPHSLSEL